MENGSTHESNGMPSPHEGAEGSKKKTPRRKPIWLAVPVEFADVVQEDSGEITREPSRYELFECAGKPDVAKVLERFQKTGAIDGTNVHFVKAFRADPIALKVSTRVSIKF